MKELIGTPRDGIEAILKLEDHLLTIKERLSIPRPVSEVVNLIEEARGIERWQQKIAREVILK